MDDLIAYAAALLPFLGAALIFYVIIKAVIESDRRERAAQAKWDAQHRSAGAAKADRDDSSGP